MPQSNRPLSRRHLFITHEFYPKRGGIATFVEEIAASACSIDADAADAVRGHSRCRDTCSALRNSPDARGSEKVNASGKAEPKTAVVTSKNSPDRKDTTGARSNELRATQASGVEVWAQRLPPRVAEKDFPFRVRRLPLHGTHDLRCVFALVRALFAERARLRETSIYLLEPGPILAFLWLQFFKTLRPRELCLTFHGSEILKLHRCPLRRVLTRRLIARATRVSTLTHYTRDLLFERFPEARSRFVLTPGAVADSRRDKGADPFLWRADKAGALVADAGGSSGGAKGGERESPRRLVVLTVGRLHPRKGQLHTLNALAALPPELQQRIEYWLVGSEATRGAGKRYAQRLRERAGSACCSDADAGSRPPKGVHPRARESAETQERSHATKGAGAQPLPCKETREESGLVVRFLGDVPDEALGAIYAQADIFALTSVVHGTSIEGFGLVYLEASAHGLPIVAHDIGGVAEAVSDGHTGLLVSPEKPDALRDAFARLIEDAELRARLGAAGPAWARRQTWRDSAAALIGVFADSPDSSQQFS